MLDLFSFATKMIPVEVSPPAPDPKPINWREWGVIDLMRAGYWEHHPQTIEILRRKARGSISQ